MSSGPEVISIFLYTLNIKAKTGTDLFYAQSSYENSSVPVSLTRRSSSLRPSPA